MSDNFVNATFKASSTIFDDRTDITWNSPICAFIVERTLIDGGDGRWEVIACVPADRVNFSMDNSSENSKFQYRIVAKMINEITLASESTGIPSLASKCKSEIGKEVNDGITMDCKPIGVQDFVQETRAFVKLHKCVHQSFRIMAVNASGDVSTPLESEQIRSLLPLPPPNVKVDTSNREYIELKWKIPAHHPTSSYEKPGSFFVQRRVGNSNGKIGKKNYTKVSKTLSAGHKRTFRDINVFPDRMYQYKVVCIGSNGSKSATMTEIVRIKSENKEEPKMETGNTKLSECQKRNVRRKKVRELKNATLAMENSKKAIKQEDEPGPSGSQQQQIPVKIDVAPICSKLVKMEIDSD